MTIDVQTICLGILAMGEATGYEIKKACEEGPVGCFIEASYGAIYPALSRMTEQGFVDLRIVPQAGKPDRKIYSLTEAGRRAFAQKLLTEPAPDRFRSEFMFLLLFADHLPKEHLTRMIDKRLAELRALMAALTAPDHACGAHSRGLEFVRRQGVAVYEAMIAHIEADRHLLEARASDRAPVKAAE